MNTDSTATGIAISDLQGRFTLLNAGAERFVELADWLQGSGNIFLPDGETVCPREQLPLGLALRGHEALGVDLWVKTPTDPRGTRVTSSCRPLRAHAGQLQGAVAFWQETRFAEAALAPPNPAAELERYKAELKHAQETAERERQFKTQFVNSISHELRTPLNAIIGFSELLEEQIFGKFNERQLHYVRTVLTSGRQLLRLINDLLQLSEFDPARMELSFEWTSLAEVVKSVCGVVRAQVEREGIAFEESIEPGIPPLYLDAMRAKQIIFSLLTNALSGARRGDTVRISAKLDGSRALVRVSATGSADHRLSDADLALTRRLMELHGGAMLEERNGVHGGSFTAVFPRLRGTEPLAQETPDNDSPAPRSLVLVVDDDAKAATLIASQLQAGGVSVAFARNAHEALRKAELLRPLAITLDLRMPGVDGFEVLNQLRAAPATASIPVVVISIIDEKKMALAHGAVDFLSKPVTAELLLNALERMGVPVCRIKGRRVRLIAQETEAMQQVEALLRLAGCEVQRLAPGTKDASLAPPELILCDVSQDGASALPGAEDYSLKIPVIALVGSGAPASRWGPPLVCFPLEDALRGDRLARAVHGALHAR